jgi:hypothetical protein
MDTTRLVPTLRDASLRDAPQGEVVFERALFTETVTGGLREAIAVALKDLRDR